MEESLGIELWKLGILCSVIIYCVHIGAHRAYASLQGQWIILHCELVAQKFKTGPLLSGYPQRFNKSLAAPWTNEADFIHQLVEVAQQIDP